MAEDGLCFLTFVCPVAAVCLMGSTSWQQRTLSCTLATCVALRAERTHLYDKVRASQERQKKADITALKGAERLTVVHK